MQHNIRHFLIYSQNISGGKTKLNAINNNLARSNFDIILLQETWLNQRIDSAEIVANTAYQVVRADRNKFINSRSEGGGVIAFIKVGINHQIIPTTSTTTIEFVAIRIKLDNKYINLYIPPYKGRMLALIGEFKKLIKEVNKLYPKDQILICGDFNLSRIHWHFTTENTGNLSPIRASTRVELRFTEVITSLGLLQMNSHPNSRNIFLDLTLSTNMTNTQVFPSLPEELIDNCSINHNATVTIITYGAVDHIPNIKSRKLKRLNLAATTNALQNHHFNQPTRIDIDETFFSEPLTLSIKIDNITATYRRIQDMNMVSSNSISHADAPKHPWTTNKKFQTLWRLRKRLKRMYTYDRSDFNGANLRTANIQLAALYNTLK